MKNLLLVAAILGGAHIAQAQTAAPFACAALPPVTPFLRAEGLTELLPDIVLQCSGGAANTAATLVAQLVSNTNLTSRIVSGSTSEAMLLTNEPAPAARILGSNAFLAQTGGSTGALNELTWSAIPTVQPGSGTLTLRFTNLRANVSQLGISSVFAESPTELALQLTANGVNALANSTSFDGSNYVYFTTGLVARSSTFAIRQCDDSGPGLLTVSGSSVLNPSLLTGGVGQIQFNVRFQELVPKGFSTQQDETGGTLPGNPSVGVATQGSRLIVSFSNIPVGIQVFVTTGPIGPTDSKTANAVMVPTDENGAGPFNPITGTAKGSCPLTGGPEVPMSPVSNGMAAWEVTADDPGAFEQLSFGVAFAGTEQLDIVSQVTALLGPFYATSAAALPSATLSIPRFIPANTPENVPITLGLTFVAVAGGGSVPAQSIAATCPSPVVSTTSGGNWLSAGSGTANGSLNVNVNPAGLAASTYFGQVVCSTGSITVVLDVVPSNIDPGPIVSPIGLLFVVPQGTTAVSPQAVMLYNLTSQPIPYVETNSTNAGNVSPSAPVTIGISPVVAGLTPGIYTQTFPFLFEGGKFERDVVARIIVTAASSVVASRPSVRAARPAASPACTPSALTAVVQSFGGQPIITTGYPVQIQVLATDNCGNPVTTGAVSVTFSSEPADTVFLQPQTYDPGLWTGSWTPMVAATNETITVTASIPNLALGMQTLTDTVVAGSATPVISPGGIVNSTNTTSTNPTLPSPGATISIYGQDLADSPAQQFSTVPLPTTLGTTQVLIPNLQRTLPLLYAAAGLVNAIWPFDLLPGDYGVVVMHGTAVSTPVEVHVSPADPGVFQINGQGAIEKAVDYSLVGPSNPAKAGDYIVIYATGLGSVDPIVPAGSLAPGVAPFSVIAGNSVSVMIGGVPAATPLYVGLTPGAVGLYQINVQVPPGVPSGDVPLVVTAGGAVASAVTISLQ
jgi:uncharacterized protein (TIGR03437 family)